MYFIEFAYVNIVSLAPSTVWYCVYNYGGIAGANQEADLAFFSQTAIQSIQKRGDILGAQWSKIIFEVPSFFSRMVYMRCQVCSVFFFSVLFRKHEFLITEH